MLQFPLVSSFFPAVYNALMKDESLSVTLIELCRELFISDPELRREEEQDSEQTENNVCQQWLQSSFASEVADSLFGDLIMQAVSEMLSSLTSEAAWISHLSSLRKMIWPEEDDENKEAKEEEEASLLPSPKALQTLKSECLTAFESQAV